MFPWHEALCAMLFASPELPWPTQVRAWRSLESLPDEIVTQLLRHPRLSVHERLASTPHAWQTRVARATTRTVSDQVECTITPECQPVWKVLASLSELQSVKLASPGIRFAPFSSVHPVFRLLTSLPNLRKLALPGGDMGRLGTEMDSFAIGLAELFAALPLLECLDLQDTAVPVSAVKHLGEGLATLQHLTSLNISKCLIQFVHHQGTISPVSDLIKGLALHIVRLRSLRSLVTQSTGLPGPPAATDISEALAPVLPGMPCLENFEVMGHTFGDAGAGSIARALRGCTHLRALTLVGSGLTCGSGLAECLKATTMLSKFCWLDDNPMNDGFADLTASICALPGLVDLEISLVGFDSVATFARHFAASSLATSLSVLGFCGKALGNDAVAQLGPALASCPQLRSLQFALESSRDPMQLCPHLARLTTLTNFAIVNENAQTLAALLPSLSSLESVGLGGGSLTAAGFTSVCDRLSTLSKLTSLEVADVFEAGGGPAVAAALSLFTGLCKLTLCCHGLEASDVSALGPVIGSMAPLTHLQLKIPQNALAGVAALAENLTSLSQLQVLDVTDGVSRNSDAGQALLRTLHRCQNVDFRFM